VVTLVDCYTKKAWAKRAILSLGSTPFHN
jgi:hypothetical protein